MQLMEELEQNESGRNKMKGTVRRRRRGGGRLGWVEGRRMWGTHTNSRVEGRRIEGDLAK